MANTKTRSYELPVEPISSTLFDVTHGSMLAAEASTLGNAFKMVPLYNDACDLGIAIQSARTGKVERFFLETVERHGGDIVAWRFRAVNHGLNHVTAVVFND